MTPGLRTIGILLTLTLSFSPTTPGIQAGELRALPDGEIAELTLPDLNGHIRTLEEFRGRVVLVSFWASWCTPCMQEMPSIQRLAKTMEGHPFTVIGINVGENSRRVQTVARQLHLGFPVLLDQDSSEFRRWGGEVLPTSFVIDSNRNLRFAAPGPQVWDDASLIETLCGLLPSSPEPPAAGPCP